MSVARACPDQPVGWEAASAAVADEFNDTGQLAGALTWQDQPAFYRLSAKAIEGDIKGFLRHETVIHFLKGGVEGKFPCLLERRLPERVEIGRFVAVRAVDFKFVERKVKECHIFLLS